MKLIVALILACSAWGQQTTISDTLKNAVGGGDWTGRITITLNSPGQASYGAISLSGWQYVLCVGVTGSDCSATTAAGVITIPIYATTTLTPANLSYTARYAPTRGTARSETWVVGAGHTTLVQIIAAIQPTPGVTVNPIQISGSGATLGQCLTFDGTGWAPTACVVGYGLTWSQLNAITWSQMQ